MRVSVRQAVIVAGFLAVFVQCRSQVIPHSSQPETSQLRIDILDPLGDQVSGAQVVLSETKQLLSTGQTYDLKPGTYRVTPIGGGQVSNVGYLLNLGTIMLSLLTPSFV